MSFETELVNLQPKLKNFAISITRGDYSRAEDLVQETILRALKNKGQFKEGTNLIAWLSTILRNEFYSQCRKKVPISDPEGIFASTLVTAPNQEVTVQVAEFYKHFANLPPEQQRVLQLIAIEGFSYEEVAAQDNSPQGTIKSRVSRARAYLKEVMGTVDVDLISIGVMTRNDNFRQNHR